MPFETSSIPQSPAPGSGRKKDSTSPKIIQKIQHFAVQNTDFAPFTSQSAFKYPLFTLSGYVPNRFASLNCKRMVE
jgi:hypothetical protein